MDKLVSLCKRRGFLFQSSEIYGGLNGFWDYGPLGVELKRAIKEAWWRDMVLCHDELAVLKGAPSAYQMVGLDTSIIMHPQVWKCSGHYDLFHDYMVDCRQTKRRYRYDQVRGRWVEAKGQRIFVATAADPDREAADVEARALRFFKLRPKDAAQLQWDPGFLALPEVEDRARVLGPDATELGTLTEPREFNLMFKTTVGALGGEEDVAFLRPETAQGIFVNFKNVLDSTRVKIPFGIAQIGKSFRNEITPRNFTFRSREFEQMEIEFFCHPEASQLWYRYWRDRRLEWYVSLGLASERLRLREHSPSELSHYSTGTADIEYAFPFLPPGEFGELEGVAHRGDFDLRSHMEGKLDEKTRPLRIEVGPDGKPKWPGSGRDLTYFDEDAWERDKEKLGVKSLKEYAERRKGEERPGWPYQYVPHVVEPSAGADRAALAFLCEAYDEDEAPDENGVPQKRVVLRLHPRLAPVKVAVLPLVRKDGMPEIARDIYRALKPHLNVFYDEKGAIGRRYRRQDEAGTPFCVTIDGQTLQDKTVTVRDRDTLEQWRVRADDVAGEIRRRVG
ncbi:MAG: glycine--tRNA ligase [Planctomycetota bacterium]